jgi:hypothetical protein
MDPQTAHGAELMSLGFFAQDFAHLSRTSLWKRSRGLPNAPERKLRSALMFLHIPEYLQGLKIRVSAVRFRPWPSKQDNNLGSHLTATGRTLSRKISRSARFVADRVSPPLLSPAQFRSQLDIIADYGRDLECAWHAHQAAEMDWTGDTELRRIFYARYVQAYEDLNQAIALADWEYARVLNRARRSR